MKTLWKCSTCGTICEESEILKAEHPFDKDEILTGCPTCKDIETFEGLCEHEDCKRISTCGFPNDDGRYIRVCGEHASTFFRF